MVTTQLVTIEKLKKELTEAKWMLKIVKDIAEWGIDIGRLSNHIVEVANKFVPCESGSLMLYYEKEQKLKIVGAQNLSPEDCTITFSKGEGFAGSVFENGKSIISNKPMSDKRFKKIDCQHFKFNSVLVCPLCEGNTIIGVLCLHNKLPDNIFTKNDLERISLLATNIAAPCRVAMLNEQVKYLSMFEESSTDCIRRDRFPIIIKDSMSKAKYATLPWAHMIVLDMDKFKTINDNYGHLYGDEIINTIGRSLKNIFSNRPHVSVCHWGGDEFAIFAVSQYKRDGIEMSKEIRRIIKQIRTKAGIISISIGLATISVNELSGDRAYDILIKQADDNMYKEKKMKDKVEEGKGEKICKK